MEWSCKQTHVWSAPRSLAGWRERMYLLLSFESPPKPKHQSRKSTCSKRENWDKWKALQIFVFKIPWEHIEFGPWKQSSICTFDFSQFSINNKKSSFSTSMCRRHELALFPNWPIHIKLVTPTLIFSPTPLLARAREPPYGVGNWYRWYFCFL